VLLDHPDPVVAQNAVQQGEAQLWQLFDAIACETLLLRGAESDLLSVATADAMASRGPRAKCVTFNGVGHAPTLMAPDQVQVIREFLTAPTASAIA
jgi:pimeloyl-ACP methyl ester carboxylesterase